MSYIVEYRAAPPRVNVPAIVALPVAGLFTMFFGDVTTALVIKLPDATPSLVHSSPV